MNSFRRALLRWIARTPEPAGLEALFTEPLPTDAEVGRQASCGAAIHETVAWLEAHGFADVGRGDLQRYAAFLLERRAAYERQGALR